MPDADPWQTAQMRKASFHLLYRNHSPLSRHASEKAQGRTQIASGHLSAVLRKKAGSLLPEAHGVNKMQRKETEGKRKNSAIPFAPISEAKRQAEKKRPNGFFLRRIAPNTVRIPRAEHPSPNPGPAFFFPPRNPRKTIILRSDCRIFLKRHAYFFSGIHCNEGPYKMLHFIEKALTSSSKYGIIALSMTKASSM